MGALPLIAAENHFAIANDAMLQQKRRLVQDYHIYIITLQISS
jgi:hypothetical protein